jgi:hypothetical protein
MGLLGNLFGDRKKEPKQDKVKQQRSPSWLDVERPTDWSKAFEFQDGEFFEYSRKSCHATQQGVYTIMRLLSDTKKNIRYLGVLISHESNGLILVVVDRWESVQGRIIREDDWTKGRFLSATRISGLTSFIETPARVAQENSYPVAPKYVGLLSLGDPKGE